MEADEKLENLRDLTLELIRQNVISKDKQLKNANEERIKGNDDLANTFTHGYNVMILFSIDLDKILEVIEG